MARATADKAHKDQAEPANVEQAADPQADSPELVEEEPTSLEQTPQSVLDDDGGLEQPSQDPNILIESDAGAEG